jgi:hypothetical protein
VSAQLTSSPPFFLPGAAFPLTDVATPMCHITLPSHEVKTNSLSPLHLPVTLRSVASPLELKLKHWIYITSRPPSLEHSTPTIHCYKKVISILVTLPITQPRLYFASSLTRASQHRSSTRCRRSISPPSHVHHFSIQWHSRWWTNWSSFTSRIIYQYVNSHKKYFKII